MSPSLDLEKAHERRILILDASSILHPTYHVLKHFSTRSGFPTGAIYGFMRTLLKLLREYPSRYMGVAFDAPGEKRRHRRYGAYKAHRPKMEDALAVQIPRVKELIDAWGISRFEESGYEADDVIATLTQCARQEHLEVLIVSGDKDLMQLVNDGVSILKPSRDGKELTAMDAAGVKSYLGIPPSKIRDYLALTGDATDNVPGVPGVGEVTARKLLQEYQTLEGVLQNASRVGNQRVREALLEHKQQAQLSYELVGLETLSMADPIPRCVLRKPDWQRIQKIFEELEFQSILKELGMLEDTTPKAAHSVECQIVLNERQLAELCERLAQAHEISLDLETTSEDDMKAQIVGVAMALEPHKGYYIPIAHEGLGVPHQLKLAAVLSKLKPGLESGRVAVIGQNLKYDAKVLARSGIHLQKIAFDSMLAGYLLDPEGRKDLNALTLRYLGHGMKSFADLGKKRMNEVAIEEAADYAARDAEAVMRLKEVLLPKLREHKLEQLFYDVELPLIPVLVAMELTGILIDREVLWEQGKELEILLDQLQREIYQLAGEEFNPNSPKQVAQILFEKLKLPVIKKTKTGPSTDALVLEQLAASHPLPERLLAHRELEKLLNTYVRRLPDHIHPETGRIHTSFNQAVTATGRLSSSEPNLQNIPIRRQLGGQIREAFIAPQGRILIGADYSQIELRILAHIAHDPGLIEAFERDEDIHARTAATIFSIPLESVSQQQRDIAKRINFGLAYGMSSFGLAQWAKIPRKDAEQFMQSYFASYPGVKVYRERIVKQAEEQGYVESLLGRRRYFGKLDSRSEREAINMPIQGSSADLMKLAMIRLFERRRAEKLKADMLLQIHDELIFEVDEDQAEKSATMIQETMESVMELAVPLKVDVRIGRNWGEI
jgi:DNA polymerase-1